MFQLFVIWAGSLPINVNGVLTKSRLKHALPGIDDGRAAALCKCLSDEGTPWFSDFDQFYAWCMDRSELNPLASYLRSEDWSFACEYY